MNGSPPVQASKGARTTPLAQIWGQVDLGTEIGPQEKELIFPTLRRAALESRHILEIGAGDGRMIRLLQREGVRAEFWAADLCARPMKAPAQACIADARSLPYPDNSFDLVYSLGVVEHFPETKVAVREHARVVRRGGVVVITTPHFSPQTFLRWLLRWKSGDYRKGTFEEVSGRNLSLQYIARLCKEAGLALDLCTGTGSVLTWPPWAGAFLDWCLPTSRFGSFLVVRGTKD